MNIVEIAAGSDDFNLLVRALSTADLVTTVQEATDITVFAPTDAAFVKLAQDLGFAGDPADEDAVFDAIVAALTGLASDGDPVPLLTDILLYHVAAGARTEPTITGSTGIATLLDGAEIAPMGSALGDGEPDLADPTIVIADIMADNGIIQAIDAVLLPIDIPGNTSITDIVAQSGNGFDDNASDFDMLLAAVQAAGLAETLDAAGADLTVFAPNDGAFIATAQALGYPLTDEAGAFNFLVNALTLLSRGTDPIPLLTAVLTYHVSAGAKDAEAVLASTTIATLQGTDLTVNGTTLKDADPELPDPNLIATDIMASNGIVHVLDGVLFPVDLLPSDGSNAVDFLIATQGPVAVDLGTDNDYLLTTGQNDLVIGGPGNDVLVDLGGIDTARFANDFDNYSISIGEDGVTTITDRVELASESTGTDALNGYELLEFGDGTSFAADGAVNLAILEGAAALSGDELETLVELYVAYFDRAPDALGLLFWGNALADGVSLREIAELFFDQPETQAKLGDLDTGAFVDTGYGHVLERTADDAGRDFWIDALDSGGVSRAEFLLELVAGARANDDAAEDVRTIEDKTDIGVSYALIEGLTNVANAETVMETYVRTDAEGSKASAQAQIEEFAVLASGAADGPEAVVQIVGAIDDPFAVA